MDRGAGEPVAGKVRSAWLYCCRARIVFPGKYGFRARAQITGRMSKRARTLPLKEKYSRSKEGAYNGERGKRKEEEIQAGGAATHVGGEDADGEQFSYLQGWPALSAVQSFYTENICRPMFTLPITLGPN